MTNVDNTVERIGGYRVVRRLATGGTSDVLLARAEGPLGFERNVVLKLLLSQFRNDDEFAKMFAREASAYARLSHPSIVRLFDFFALPPGGETPGREGQLVMVLEHVDGPSLSRFRSLLKAIGKDLEDRAALYVAACVFDALASAHATADASGNSAPVIHRDVNPSNILLPFDGQVKLADFGLAKVTGLDHQSVAGMIKGTYGYMAPEQITGDPVSPRADVYSAGIVLWELLTRRRAFQRGALPEVEALRAIAEPRLVSLDQLRPDVDKAVRDALRRALEPRGDRRTITAEELVAVLTRIVRPDEGRELLASALQLVRGAAREGGDEASHPVEIITTPSPEIVVPPPPRSSKSKQIVVKPSSARVPIASRTTMAFGSPVLEAGKPKAPGSSGSGRAVAPPAPEVPLPRSAGSSASQKAVSAPTAPSGPPPSSRGPAIAKSAAAEAPKIPSRPKLYAATAPVGSAGPPDAGARPEVRDPRAPAPPNPKRFSSAVRIDEVLRDVPSSMPPSILDDPASSAPPIEVIPPLGAIPPAPLPMKGMPVAIIGPAPEEVTPGGPPTGHTPASGAGSSTLVMTPPTPEASPSAGLRVAETKTQVMASITSDALRAHSVAMADNPDENGPRLAWQEPPAVLPEPGMASTPPEPDDAAAVGRRRSGLTAIVVCLLLIVAISIGGAVLYQEHTRSRAAAQRVTTPVASTAAASTAAASTAVVAAPVTESSATAVGNVDGGATLAAAAEPLDAGATPPSEPAASASASTGRVTPSPVVGGSLGVLKTTGAAPGRRIFVDDKTLGQTPESLIVGCGRHTVRLGSSGKTQAIDVPCGGEVTVSDKF